VELPEIELGTKILLNCGNTEFDDGKRREKNGEMPCGDARGVDGVKT
jgi:hypothetical protein